MKLTSSKLLKNKKINKKVTGGGQKYRPIIDILIGILIGGLIFAPGVFAVTSVLSSTVSYDNSNTELTSTNVQDALDELYMKLTTDPITAEGTLFYKMSSNATLDTNISFSSISSDSNGKGVYELSSTASDTYPIYYYRGAVTDNNVLFAGFCWKIVRTTETGGIKLIYNGTPTDGTCDNTGTDSQIGTSAFNSSYIDNAYVGYMYGTTGSSSYDATHANTNDSTIKTAIDNWYASNMTSYTDKLEDTVWCNDRSIDSSYGTGLGYGTNQTGYMARYRLYTNKAPSLECSGANDRFTVSTDNGNGALTYPVGLLTADEIAYAGAVYNTSNSTYYLYTGQIWWAGSPSYFNGSTSSGWHVSSGGGLYGTDVGKTLGVRPALSLAPGSLISSGSGTVEDPYVVS